jgi:two-component system sensor histidine kinase/response regulator
MENTIHKILLVDDRPANLEALQALLEQDDREFFLANSGAEGLKLAMQVQPTLILLDVQMPEMDGFEVAEFLSSNKKTEFIPIIFVTAIDYDKKYQVKGLEQGAVDFLFKPLDPVITRNKVNSVLRLAAHEKELKKLNDSLALKNDQLAVQNHELEQFAYIISHDLKAPLKNIRSILGLVMPELEEKISPENKDFLNMITAAAGKMDKLIEDILAYSKNTSLQEQKQKFVLDNIISDVLSLLNPGDNVEIIKEGLNEEVFFQPTALHQVIQNITSNALKYNNKEKAIIQYKAWKQNNYVCLSIEDNGSGIPEKFLDSIFELFTTLDNNSNRESSTGVGLAVVKKLITKNEAKIEVNSEVNVYTRFTITFSA